MNKTPSPPHEPPLQQSPSPNCGQYYVLLADITAHHTGYHKLVEAPTLCRRSSSPLPPRDTMTKGSKAISSNDDKDGLRDLLKIGAAELLGTAFLLFLGCMGCTSGLHHGSISSLQPALTFGFAVAAIIQMFGHISQAHLNPAITLAAVVLRVCSFKRAIVYVVAQCLGAVLGYGFLKAVTPEKILIEDMTDHGFCTTIPNKELTLLQAFLAEYLATAVLIFVLCGSWDRRNASMHDSVAIKFGLTIAALALAVGPYTGASMNPARSFGPAFWNSVWKHHWIYWVAPLTSAASVAFFYRCVFEEDAEESRGNGDGEDTGIPLTSRNSAPAGHNDCTADENRTGFSSV